MKQLRQDLSNYDFDKSIFIFNHVYYYEANDKLEKIEYNNKALKGTSLRD